MDGVAGSGDHPRRSETHEVPPVRADGPHLDGYVRRQISDRDEAEQVTSELYLPTRLDLSRDSAPLRMEITGLRIGAITAGRLSYGRLARLRTADAQNFHINAPLAGRVSSASGVGQPVETGPGQGLVFSPDAPADIMWSTDSAQLCLMIPRGRLESELERLLDRTIRDRLRFEFAPTQRGPLDHRWRTAMNFIAEELDNPSNLAIHPVATGHLEGVVLDTLLLVHPHNYSEIALRHSPRTPSAVIKRALEVIEERPTEPWSTVRLASEVHVSVRALQEGFSRDVGTPPMTHLRQVRLRRAYEALMQADRQATTVRAVATSYGFLHMSRFAAAYRETFGELPSETLNRFMG
ncbi:MAG: AraC family transcriptional regulator [Marmoricola sp.]|nr:AraC family transcriptional regulator [Marmoricola sp.]